MILKCKWPPGIKGFILSISLFSLPKLQMVTNTLFCLLYITLNRLVASWQLWLFYLLVVQKLDKILSSWKPVMLISIQWLGLFLGLLRCFLQFICNINIVLPSLVCSLVVLLLLFFQVLPALHSAVRHSSDSTVSTAH